MRLSSVFLLLVLCFVADISSASPSQAPTPYAPSGPYAPAPSLTTSAPSPSLQAPSLAPSLSCDELIVGDLVECIPFVCIGRDDVFKPDSGCCDALKTFKVECVCEAFRNTEQFGIVLNVTKAVSLPAACGLKDSSLNYCLSGSAPSPTGSPHVDLAPAPAPAPTSNRGDDDLTPAPAPSKSGVEVAPSPPSAPGPPPAPSKPKKSSASVNSISLAALASLAAVSFYCF